MKPQLTRLAAYGLISENNRVMLCRLSNRVAKWTGYWTLPGGGVEFGESPEQAMMREVREETGLQVESRGVAGIDSIVDTSGPEDRHGIRIIYYAKVVGGTLGSELTGSTDLCAWHQVDRLAAIKIVDLVTVGIRFLSKGVDS